MMTLVRHLPLFIGDLVDHDDDHWECFLLLWDICSVVCSFELTTDDATHLGWLIETYLEAFTSLYGASVTPKMHYLVHLPKQILMSVFTSSILHVQCHIHVHVHVLFFIGLAHSGNTGACDLSRKMLKSSDLYHHRSEMCHSL